MESVHQKLFLVAFLVDIWPTRKETCGIFCSITPRDNSGHQRRLPFMSLSGWCLFVCLLVVFNVPSTARSFRDGTPIYCPLRRTWSSINTPFRPGIEPRAVTWQSITLPLCYASSTVSGWYKRTWKNLTLLHIIILSYQNPTTNCSLTDGIKLGDVLIYIMHPTRQGKPVPPHQVISLW